MRDEEEWLTPGVDAGPMHTMNRDDRDVVRPFEVLFECCNLGLFARRLATHNGSMLGRFKVLVGFTWFVDGHRNTH